MKRKQKQPRQAAINGPPGYFFMPFANCFSPRHSFPPETTFARTISLTEKHRKQKEMPAPPAGGFSRPKAGQKQLPATQNFFAAYNVRAREARAKSSSTMGTSSSASPIHKTALSCQLRTVLSGVPMRTEMDAQL